MAVVTTRSTLYLILDFLRISGFHCGKSDNCRIWDFSASALSFWVLFLFQNYVSVATDGVQKQVFLQLGNGCSTVVDHMPQDPEVAGSSPAKCWAFSIAIFYHCVLKQVPYKGATFNHFPYSKIVYRNFKILLGTKWYKIRFSWEAANCGHEEQQIVWRLTI